MSSVRNSTPLGMKTYLRYFTEFNNFDVETFKKKVEDYWSVPGMHGRGLVESFEVRKQFYRLDSSEVRDYVAILGVNAVSAEDGTLYFLQHMSNISKDLEQARKIILVVSVEKVLKDREAALFHTRSMGIFGLESILLDLNPNPTEVYDFEQLPVLSGIQDRRSPSHHTGQWADYVAQQRLSGPTSSALTAGHAPASVP